MVILSLDASTTSTGWAVFHDGLLLDYGCIKPQGEGWRDRLIHQDALISDLIIRYRPNQIVVEDVPLKSSNAKVLIILGAVQGFLCGLVARHGLTIKFVPPSTWRSSIGLFTGDREGTTRKELKRKSVEKANKIFGLNLRWVSMNSGKNDDDISDAILLGYYWWCEYGR